MSPDDLAFLSVGIAVLTVLMSIASIILDRKTRQRLAQQNRVMTRRVEAQTDAQARVLLAVRRELGPEALEWSPDYQRGYTECAKAVLKELEQ